MGKKNPTLHETADLIRAVRLLQDMAVATDYRQKKEKKAAVQLLTDWILDLEVDA